MGAAAAVGLVFYSIWDSVNRRTSNNVRGFASTLDRAGMKMKAEEVVLSTLGIAVVAWIAIVFLVKPPFLIAAVLFPVCLAVAAGGFYTFVRFKTKRRLAKFVEQLELSLRLIGSGLRVGLGLRQALMLVIEELPEPSKYEFMRVVGQTNIGVSAYDAIDDLAARMPATETIMMARAIRIQSQTGGDLAGVLDQLAAMIKDRRRIARKISALTSEGRASALILTCLPLALGSFLVVAQPAMGHALLFTMPGHITITIVVVLETLGAIVLNRLLQVDV
jgi:tight adherence protein B